MKDALLLERSKEALAQALLLRRVGRVKVSRPAAECVLFEPRPARDESLAAQRSLGGVNDKRSWSGAQRDWSSAPYYWPRDELPGQYGSRWRRRLRRHASRRVVHGTAIFLNTTSGAATCCLNGAVVSVPEGSNSSPLPTVPLVRRSTAVAGLSPANETSGESRACDRANSTQSAQQPTRVGFRPGRRLRARRVAYLLPKRASGFPLPTASM